MKAIKAEGNIEIPIETTKTRLIPSKLASNASTDLVNPNGVSLATICLLILLYFRMALLILLTPKGTEWKALLSEKR